MAKTNVRARNKVLTHEGAPATAPNAREQLKRSVNACMLWEDEFYEDGESIADRIAALAVQVPDADHIAVEAREKMHLRHAPLWICRALAKAGKLKASTLERVIQRADELCEFLAMYWRDGRQPVSWQVKRGLGAAFRKFDEYQLAKYDRGGQVKLRDVLRIVHPRPTDREQGALWGRLKDGNLKAPDTWEVALSSGADPKATWERLIGEGKLGGLAMLRNLRNMQKVGVSTEVIRQGLRKANVSRVLPFRFIAAARFAPQLEPDLEEALLRSLDGKPKLPGSTLILVDHSGSMQQKISSKSDMLRWDAGAGVAMVARELCEDVRVFVFAAGNVRYRTTYRGEQIAFEVPPRRGFALRDAMLNRLDWGGTLLGKAVAELNELNYDRLIVVTDEQSHDPVPAPKGKGYMINVASYNRGVGYGQWLHINGWSESVLDYIREVE